MEVLIPEHESILRQSPVLIVVAFNYWLFLCIFSFAFVLLIGLTPDVISAVDKKGRHDNPKDPQLYHYKSGSDGDLDSDQERSAKHASLNVNHQGSQCSISSNELDHEPSRQNGNVSRLSMSDSEQENVSHRHSHAFHQPHVHQPCMAHHIPYPALHHAGKSLVMSLCFKQVISLTFEWLQNDCSYLCSNVVLYDFYMFSLILLNVFNVKCMDRQ